MAAVSAIAIGCKSSNGDDSSQNMETSKTKQLTFAQVQPLIMAKCGKCHGENGKAGIDLRTYETLMKGGDEGPIVKPGDPDGSVMIQALHGTHGKKQMPMKQPPLAPNETKQIEDWIKAGAKA